MVTLNELSANACSMLRPTHDGTDEEGEEEDRQLEATSRRGKKRAKEDDAREENENRRQL